MKKLTAAEKRMARLKRLDKQNLSERQLKKLTRNDLGDLIHIGCRRIEKANEVALKQV